jgi:hypothetical protein
LEAVRAALAQEDMRNRQAIDRRAAELGEERWVLDVANSSSFAPVTAGFLVETVRMADMDSVSEHSDEEFKAVIKKYGPKVCHNCKRLDHLC